MAKTFLMVIRDCEGAAVIGGAYLLAADHDLLRGLTAMVLSYVLMFGRRIVFPGPIPD